jgi:hypothetical protein
MTPAYFTVVYQVTGDEAAQDAWWQTIRPLFFSDEDIPIKITSISMADEFTRLNNIREILTGDQDVSDKLDAIEDEMERR